MCVTDLDLEITEDEQASGPGQHGIGGRPPASPGAWPSATMTRTPPTDLAEAVTEAAASC